MAPVKKSKSINKVTAAYDSSCSRDEKSKPKKRKLSDMLGSQWSEAELQRFYEAYRKYGRDWKKVAIVVRSRSTEMVEALYTMNRAYLSLPEGTVTVSGLIAMMTDHYNVMDGSGSEKETEDITLMAHKVQKHQKAKGRLDIKRQASFQRQSISSSDKLLRGNSLQRPSISSSGKGISLSKMFDGIQPNFPVRKRTPRVPVLPFDSHVNTMPERSIMNGNTDDERSHGVSLLKKAKEIPNLARDSETTYKRVEHFRISQASSWEKPKSGGLGADEESVDDSLGSYEDRMEKKIKNSVDSRSGLNDYKRGKKEKKKEVDISQAIMFNDVRDTHKFSDKGPMTNENSVNEGVKLGRSHSGHRKRNKTQIFEADEQVACDALQTLADMSLMMPYLDAEPVEDVRESVTKQYSSADKDAQFDVTLQEDILVPSKKRKPRSSKKVEQHLDHSEKKFEKEVFADEEVKSGDSNADLSAVSKRLKSSVRSPDLSSSNDQHMGEAGAVVSSTQVPDSSHVMEPTRRRCRRKRDRTIPQKDINHANDVSCSQSSLFQGSVKCAKEKVLHCLSWPEVRRWCSYEWFYSAIDYPWFARREFVEYLNHVGLGHIPRLTRVEWGVIRSSLGKPRRFSERFLQEEREKLEQYRESVRSHYANVRAGLGDGLPNDLARPLSVGQKVVAIHPKTRELHNGSVLAVDHHSCLVQFDRRDLGVEFVKDIDCMPLNPVENMPESRRQHKMLLDYRHPKLPKINEAFTLASDEHVQIRSPPLRAPPFSPATANDVKVKQVCTSSRLKVAGDGCPRIQETTQIQDLVQMQPRKADMMPSPCLAQGLDTKVSGQHPLANSDCVNGTLHSSDSSIFRPEEETSNVVEIVQGSMQKAQKMVDVAVKAMCSMRKGEDAYGLIGEAFDTCKAEHVTDCRMSSVMLSSDTAQGGLTPQNAIASSSSTAACDLQVPSELISSCVSTLLMIQTCTERQYPPSEVAQILDTAVRSLHPCSSQNLSIYREIQMCMGRIKTQILALVPS